MSTRGGERSDTLLVKDDVLAVSDEAVGSFSFVSSWLLKIVTWFFGLWLDNCDPKARPASEANTQFCDVLEMNGKIEIGHLFNGF